MFFCFFFTLWWIQDFWKKGHNSVFFILVIYLVRQNLINVRKAAQKQTIELKGIWNPTPILNLPLPIDNFKNAFKTIYLSCPYYNTISKENFNPTYKKVQKKETFLHLSFLLTEPNHWSIFWIFPPFCITLKNIDKSCKGASEQHFQ